MAEPTLLTFEVAKNIGLAILLGSLIGLQREHSTKKGDKRFAGIRTFMLISLLGAMSVHLSQVSDPRVLLVITGAFMIFVIAAYYRESAGGMIGATTEVASMVAFLIGAFCALEKVYTAVFVAIATTAILEFKGRLHDFAARIKEREIYSTLSFTILAFVILPLLPNTEYGFGAYKVFNPFFIMLMVVLICGMSFAAYILIKALGEQRGLGLTGLLGGFISSTAITTTLATQSKRTPFVKPVVFGIVTAGSIMFIRVLIMVSVLNKELFKELLIPFGIMATVGFIAALTQWKEKNHDPHLHKHVTISSPFTYGPALKFALFFTLILFLSKAGQMFVGDKALYALSLFSGLVDVDPITVSLANSSNAGEVLSAVAVLSIMIAAAANTLFKAGIVFALGTREVAYRVLVIFLVMLICGTLATLIF